jgi:hypothetical protein
MKTAQEFLREFQSRSPLAHLPRTEPKNLTVTKELPPEVRLGLELGWKMAPISAGAAWASSCPSVCPPTSKIPVLERWFAHYPQSNWVLRTGNASSVVGVSFHKDIAIEALQNLSEENDVWRSTLRFRSGPKLTFLFRLPGVGARNPVRRTFEGIQVYFGSLLLVPPSCISGEVLKYRNPLSRPLDMPDLTLLERPEWAHGYDRDSGW